MSVRYQPPIQETYVLPWAPPPPSPLIDGTYYAKRRRKQVLASVDSIYLPDEAGSQVVELPGLRGRTPELAIFFGAKASAAGTSTSDHAYFSMGFATGPSERASIALVSRDNLATSQADRRYTTEFVYSPREYGGTGQIESDLQAFDAGTISLEHTGSSTGSYVLNLLTAAELVERAEVQQLALGGSGSGEQEFDFSFTPDTIFLMSPSNVTSPPDDQTHVQFAFSAFDQSGLGYGARVLSMDSRGTSDCSAQLLENMVSGYINTSQSVNTRVDFSSYISDGVRFSRIATFPNYVAFCMALKLRPAARSQSVAFVQPAADGTARINLTFRPSFAVFYSVGDPTLSDPSDTTVSAGAAFFLGSWSAAGGSQSSCGYVDQDNVSTTNSSSAQSDSLALYMTDADQDDVGSLSVQGNGLGLDLRWTNCDGIERRGAAIIFGGG